MQATQAKKMFGINAKISASQEFTDITKKKTSNHQIKTKLSNQSKIWK